MVGCISDLYRIQVGCRLALLWKTGIERLTGHVRDDFIFIEFHLLFHLVLKEPLIFKRAPGSRTSKYFKKLLDLRELLDFEETLDSNAIFEIGWQIWRLE